MHLHKNIPNFVVVDASPKMEFHFSALVHDERLSNGKIDREPGEHPLRVRLRHDRKTMALVKH